MNLKVFSEPEASHAGPCLLREAVNTLNWIHTRHRDVSGLQFQPKLFIKCSLQEQGREGKRAPQEPCSSHRVLCKPG
jgi:hypothetical protein